MQFVLRLTLLVSAIASVAADDVEVSKKFFEYVNNMQIRHPTAPLSFDQDAFTVGQKVVKGYSIPNLTEAEILEQTEHTVLMFSKQKYPDLFNVSSTSSTRKRPPRPQQLKRENAFLGGTLALLGIFQRAKRGVETKPAVSPDTTPAGSQWPLNFDELYYLAREELVSLYHVEGAIATFPDISAPDFVNSPNSWVVLILKRVTWDALKLLFINKITPVPSLITENMKLSTILQEGKGTHGSVIEILEPVTCSTNPTTNLSILEDPEFIKQIPPNSAPAPKGPERKRKYEIFKILVGPTITPESLKEALRKWFRELEEEKKINSKRLFSLGFHFKYESQAWYVFVGVPQRHYDNQLLWFFHHTKQAGTKRNNVAYLRSLEDFDGKKTPDSFTLISDTDAASTDGEWSKKHVQDNGAILRFVFNLQLNSEWILDDCLKGTSFSQHCGNELGDPETKFLHIKFSPTPLTAESLPLTWRIVLTLSKFYGSTANLLTAARQRYQVPRLTLQPSIGTHPEMNGYLKKYVRCVTAENEFKATSTAVVLILEEEDIGKKCSEVSNYEFVLIYFQCTQVNTKLGTWLVTVTFGHYVFLTLNYISNATSRVYQLNAKLMEAAKTHKDSISYHQHSKFPTYRATVQAEFLEHSSAAIAVMNQLNNTTFNVLKELLQQLGCTVGFHVEPFSIKRDTVVRPSDTKDTVRYRVETKVVVIFSPRIMQLDADFRENVDKHILIPQVHIPGIVRDEEIDSTFRQSLPGSGIVDLLYNNTYNSYGYIVTRKPVGSVTSLGFTVYAWSEFPKVLSYLNKRRSSPLITDPFMTAVAKQVLENSVLETNSFKREFDLNDDRLLADADADAVDSFLIRQPLNELYTTAANSSLKFIGFHWEVKKAEGETLGKLHIAVTLGSEFLTAMTRLNKRCTEVKALTKMCLVPEMSEVTSLAKDEAALKLTGMQRVGKGFQDMFSDNFHKSEENVYKNGETSYLNLMYREMVDNLSVKDIKSFYQYAGFAVLQPQVEEGKGDITAITVKMYQFQMPNFDQLLKEVNKKRKWHAQAVLSLRATMNAKEVSEAITGGKPISNIEPQSPLHMFNFKMDQLGGALSYDGTEDKLRSLSIRNTKTSKSDDDYSEKSVESKLLSAFGKNTRKDYAIPASGSSQHFVQTLRENTWDSIGIWIQRSNKSADLSVVFVFYFDNFLKVLFLAASQSKEVDKGAIKKEEVTTTVKPPEPKMVDDLLTANAYTQFTSAGFSGEETEFTVTTDGDIDYVAISVKVSPTAHSRKLVLETAYGLAINNAKVIEIWLSANAFGFCCEVIGDCWGLVVASRRTFSEISF